MERARQVAAIVAGILVIIVLILLARWTGDRIREKFLAPKPVTQTQTIRTTQIIETDKTAQTTELSQKPPQNLFAVSKDQPAKVSSLSAIPATGPADSGYLAIAFLLLGGTASLALARR